jgi:exosortase
MNPQSQKQSSVTDARGQLALAVVLLGGLLWAYAPTLARLFKTWSDDPHYSHGFLVPLFSLYLLYMKKDEIRKTAWKWNAWGLVLVGAGVLLKLAGAALNYDWVDAFSLLPALAGVLLLVGGWGQLRWTWPAVAFLFFMIPLPFRVERALGWPLQWIATKASTFVLQTCGLAALADGNVIHMTHGDIGVVEACSGMGILLLFFAVSTAVALVIERPLFDKVMVVLSAVPIALISNIVRVSVTGILHETVGERIANLVFHDLAGWLMMPIALALLGIELWFLKHAITWETVDREESPVKDLLVPGRTPAMAAIPASNPPRKPSARRTRRVV